MTLLSGFDHMTIQAPADCQESARAFFGEFLGLPELPHPPVVTERGGLWFGLPDGRQLHIAVCEPFAPLDVGHPALRCPDLDAFVTRAAEYGVTATPDTLLAPLRRVFLSDPWGNRLEVIERPGAT